MVDTLELEDRNDWDELSWLSDFASHLGHTDAKGARLPILKRIEIVSDYTPDQLEALKEYMNLVSDYGVREKIVTRCNDCGHMIESEVSINAHMFQ
jgi:hypothetical protein